MTPSEMGKRSLRRRSRVRNKQVNPALERFEERLLLSTVLVTKQGVDDASTGTLSQAIVQVNAGNADAIAFNIPGPGPVVIQENAPLPAITAKVLIDGTSETTFLNQPGGTFSVVIQGSAAAGDGLVLGIGSDHSTIQGLDLVGFSGPNASAIHVESTVNSIQNNEIGTNPAGTAAGPGNTIGVLIDNVAGNAVGGTASLGDLISGNATGVQIQGAGATGNLVQGNRIGTQADGASPLPNTGTGVLVVNGASGDFIGAADASIPTNLANTIAFNATAGVGVAPGASAVILSDAIFQDGSPAIVNTSGPAAPNLTGATTLGNTTLVQGRLDGTSGATYTLEFFGNPAADPTGSGQGQTYLGSMPVTIPGGSTSTVFTASLPVAVPIGSVVSATATSTTGTAFDNTSSFSNDVSVANPFLVTNSNPGGFGSLSQAILNANANPGTTNTITFAVPGPGPIVMPVPSSLTISNPVVIDGTTESTFLNQPGAVTVVLQGNSGTGDGLVLGAGSDRSTIKGLDLVGFGGAGAAAIHVESAHNAFQDDQIGTDATGTAAGPGNTIGVLIDNVANNTVGGSKKVGNLISANGVGVQIQGASATGNLVQGNLIGTQADGASPLGNAGTGVLVTGGASGDFIGATDGASPTNLGNTIAFNATAGVSVSSGSSAVILSDAIFQDGSAGIVNASGPAAPTLTGATTFGNLTIVEGTISGPAGTYTVEFFSNPAADPTGFGQGQTFLGSATETIPSGSFSVTLPVAVPIGSQITATATSMAGAAFVNTSSFSHDQPVANPFLVTNNRAGGLGSLSQAIADANAAPAGTNTVTFAVPGPGPIVIPVPSSLTISNNPIVIDGTTESTFLNQPGAVTVVLQGNSGTGDGLVLGAGSDRSTIKGLDLVGFGGANAAAIRIQTNGNTVADDLIGTDLTGAAAGPGNANGVVVNGTGNTIGGTAAGAANTIAFNATSGVSVAAGASAVILSNAIFQDGGDGISTASGPASPTLTGVSILGNTTTIQGILNAPSGTYTLDFFSNPAADPTGFGQGQTFLGSMSVTIPGGSTSAAFTDSLNFAIPSGSVVTATATSMSGAAFVNTSGFSNDQTAVNPFLVTNKNAGGLGSLSQAIANANAHTGTTNTITFQVPGPGPIIIPVPSTLTITNPIILSGASESAFLGSPGAVTVELQGTSTTGDGLVLGAGSDHSTIGGLDLVGFGGAGAAAIHVASANNTIQGDDFGFDVSGTIGNASNTIGVLVDNAAGNTVGGQTSSGNLISNNVTGVEILGVGATGNLVQGNLIGTRADGVTSLPNTGDGILLTGGASGNTVGSTAAASATAFSNIIEFNKGAGVNVSGSTGDTIFANTIASNVGAGVNVASGSSSTISSNAIFQDGGDGISTASGPAAPVLTGVSTLGNTTTFQGTISGPVGTYTLEFFNNPAADPSGSGQGQVFLGSATATIPSGSFSVTLPVALPTGGVVSATVTAPGGNTSSFSNDFAVLTPFLVTNTNTSGIGSLSQAIANANANPGTTNTITFAVPGPGPIVIPVPSSLTISNPVVIDGTSESAFLNQQGTITVELVGTATTGDGLVLGVGSGHSTIKGLDLVGFGGAGAAAIHVETAGNAIQNNEIGTNPAGTAAGPGNTIGVLIDNVAGNAVGGTTALGNLISANGVGVEITGAGATGNLVQGNRIGTQADGASPLPNTGTGVLVVNGASGDFIGATDAASPTNLGNTIAFNTTSGVSVASGASAVILSDAIFQDGGDGIATASGPAAPVLTGVSTLANTTTIQGTISGPAGTYTLDFFSNPAADPTGSGQGQVFLGSATATIPSGSFSVTLPVAVPTGSVVAATLTSMSGSAFVNTSGFSNDFTVLNPFLVTNTNPNGVGSLSQAIANANGHTGTTNTITFAVPGPGPILIPVPSSLTITNPVVIDGTSESAFLNQQGTITVELVGTATTGDGLVLGVGSGHSTIKGLDLVGFGGAGAAAIHVETAGNAIQNNEIGTNPAGTAAGPGNTIGVLIDNVAGNAVGGTTSLGNLISANGVGVEITGASATGTLVQGNRIGTQSSGAAPLANTGDGVLITGGASANTIGAPDATFPSNLGNTIAFNQGFGVDVAGNTSDTILSDSISSNVGGGIFTATGAAVPVLTSARSIGTTTTIQGTLAGPAGAVFTVEFFSSPSGGAQGQTYIGSATVTTTGNATPTPFSASLPLAVPTGNVVTATATSKAGAAFVNTSAFSGAQDVISSFVVINTRDSGFGSLRQAILDTNANAGADSITFNIPTSDPGFRAATGSWAIALSSALPTITETLTIDATTQPGYNGTPIVEVDANGVAGDGLILGTNTVAAPNTSSAGSSVKGLDLAGFSGAAIHVETSSNLILNDYFGTDIKGQVVDVGGGNGIGVEIDNAPNNTIGGLTTAGNLISGNGIGVEIMGGGATGNRVQGNLIGTQANGTSSLANTGAGVLIASGASGNIIGSTEAVAVPSNLANIIAFNKGAGVANTAGTANTVLSDSIFGNAGTGTADTAKGIVNPPGPNVPSAPTLTNATSLASAGGNTTLIDGTIAAPGSYTLEFFSNPSPDASNFGQGQTFLGSMNVTTSVANGGFSVTLQGAVPSGSVVTATATSLSGGAFVSTSEFSNDETVASPFQVTNNNPSGVGSLSQAILNANQNTGTTNTITFRIPGPGPIVIPVPSTLTITNPIVIDGSTETVFLGQAAGTVTIELQGSSATGDGLVLGAGSGHSTIEDLALVGFTGANAAALRVNSGNNTIVSNLIGTDPNGTGHVNQDGIVITGSQNTVGGTRVSGGNLTGLNPDGDALLAGNVIAFNAGAGINTAGGAGNTLSRNLVFGNGAPISSPITLPANTLTAATSFTGQTQVEGTFTGIDTDSYTVEYFASQPNASPARVFLGSLPLAPANLISHVGNSETFDLSDTFVTPISLLGQMVTATVTDTTTGATTSFAPPISITSGFVVTNVKDGGIGSLRQVIENVDADPDPIVFQVTFSLPGPFVIAPVGTAFDPIIHPVNLDATTQPGFSNNTPIVSIDGGMLNAFGAFPGDGLLLGSGSNGSTIKGFHIYGFAGGAGIDVQSDGNLIVEDVLGNDSVNNPVTGNSIGLLINGGASNIIGGVLAANTPDPARANIIGGNLATGIQVQGSTARLNLIAGNFIGTVLDTSNKPTVNLLLGNGGSGILFTGTASSNIVGPASASAVNSGPSNVIANNRNSGVLVNSGVGNTIRDDTFLNNQTSLAYPTPVAQQLAANTRDINLGTNGNDALAAPVLVASTFDPLKQQVLVDVKVSGEHPGDLVQIDFYQTAPGPAPAFGPSVPAQPEERDYIRLAQPLTGTIGPDGTFEWFNAVVMNNVSALPNLILGATVTVLTGGTPPGSKPSSTAGDTSPFSAFQDIASFLIVTNLGDATPQNPMPLGSLRAAIANAQAFETANPTLPAPTIVFNLPAALETGGTAANGAALGGFVIPLSAPLTLTAGGVTIDGFSEDQFLGLPASNGIVVDLDAGAFAAGLPDPSTLIVRGSKDTIQGLAFTSNGNGAAIHIVSTGGPSTPQGTVIQGDYLGTDITGLSGTGNFRGIVIDNSNGNTIGGSSIGGRVVISGNDDDGIIIENGSRSNVIQDTFIGTAPTGSYNNDENLPGKLANHGNGVVIKDSTMNTVGGPAGINVISGNFLDGVLIDGSSGADTSGNQVINSFIGIDVSGTKGSVDLGNGGDGIDIKGASRNTIGGTAPGSLNLISGNYGDGIQIQSVPATTAVPVVATGNLIANNFIGTDISGTISSQTIGNALNGIELDSTTGNIIGGTIDGTGTSPGNLISGNLKAGILIDDDSKSNAPPDAVQQDFNFIEGNKIGTTASGNSDLNNGADGIEIFDSGYNTIGGNSSSGAATAGTGTSPGNLITGNNGNGILISGPFAQFNVIQDNILGARTSNSQTAGNAFNGLAITNASNNTVNGNTIDGNGFGSFERSQPSTSNVHQGRPGQGQTGTSQTVARDSYLAITAGNFVAQTNNTTATGLSDLVVVDNQVTNAGTTATVLRVLHQQGSGAYSPITTSDAVNKVPTLPDGTQDLGPFLLGSGHFVAGASSTLSDVAVASANPKADLIYIFQPVGDGSFQLDTGRTISLGQDATGAVTALAVGDLQASTGQSQALDDLVVAVKNPNSDTSTLLVYFNGAGSNPARFTVAGTVTGITINDFNLKVESTSQQSHLNDIAVTSFQSSAGAVTGSQVQVFLNQGSDAFTAGPILAVTPSDGTHDVLQVVSVASGQFNFAGDSNADLVLAAVDQDPTAKNPDRAYILEGNGDGTFSPVPTPNSGAVPAFYPLGNLGIRPGQAVFSNLVVAGSFEGNNLGDDIAVLDAGGAEVTLLSTNGNGLFSTPTNYDAGATPTGIAEVTPQGGRSPSIAVSNAINTSAGAASILRTNFLLLSARNSNGIAITGDGTNAFRNVIQGNFIGLDISGAVARGNAADGIRLDGATSNLIGGNSLGTANVISGNLQDGIHLAGAQPSGAQASQMPNLIWGNLIGTDAKGQTVVDFAGHALGNRQNGVLIEGVRADIGGPDQGDGNTISGNGINGIRVVNAPANLGASSPVGTLGNAAGSRILGNTIGLNLGGTQAVSAVGTFNLGNDLDGIMINDVGQVTVGGTTRFARNVISGNLGRGIEVDDTLGGYMQTQILSNLIGTDQTGLLAAGAGGHSLGNFGDGIFLNNASGTTIQGPASATVDTASVISNNRGFGIHVVNTQRGPFGLLIADDFIGTDATGAQTVSDGNQLGNSSDGIFLDSIDAGGGQVVIIGNVVSGNRSNGIDLLDSSHVQVMDNEIGTDRSGETSLGNAASGVFLNQSSNNTIGGRLGATGNVISGNLSNGIVISGGLTLGASGNVIQGNILGLDKLGAKAIPNILSGIFVSNATTNLIGGSEPNQGNVISGNLGSGLQFVNAADGNIVIGNMIGTDPFGTVALGNSADGITVIDSTGNVIGSADSPNDLNVISGNISDGVRIFGASAFNLIQHNLIGTKRDGQHPLPNHADGVLLDHTSRNIVGGSRMSQGNIISGNLQNGVQVLDGGSNTVLGNLIGTDYTGTQDAGNGGDGVLINGSSSNLIGSLDDAALSQNVISGNQQSGVVIFSPPGMILGSNIVNNNYIGTDLGGTRPLGNGGDGVFIIDSNNNMIGGASGASATATFDNVISANAQSGIEILSTFTNSGSGNVINRAAIGTDATGTVGLGNLANGIYIIDGNNNTIGHPSRGLPIDSVVSGNAQNGVEIFSTNAGTTATGNTIDGLDIGVGLTGNVIPNQQNGVLLINAVNDQVGLPAAGATGVFDGTNVPTSPTNVISGNGLTGVQLIGSSSQDALFGNYIGVGLNGREAAGLGNPVGVLLSNAGQNGNLAGNLIGLGLPGDGNIISGSNLENSPQGVTIGVELNGPLSTGNVVQGNLIGLDGSGLAAGNSVGVLVNNAPANFIGGSDLSTRNIISGNLDAGVEISGAGSTGDVVSGNYIGTNIAGNASVASSQFQASGVLISNASGNVIGGPAANVISGNQDGVQITGAPVTNANTNNVVQGDLIGTNAALTGVVPNVFTGVFINASPNNVVQGNILSGNGISGQPAFANAGILIFNKQSTGNTVSTNIIGPANKRGDAIPGAVQPNGVVIIGASSNTISGNTIDDNGAANVGGTGVYITRSDFRQNTYQVPVGNQVVSNTIGNNLTYGVLRYNAPENDVPLSGRGKNTFFGTTQQSLRDFLPQFDTGATIPSKTKATKAAAKKTNKAASVTTPSLPKVPHLFTPGTTPHPVQASRKSGS